MPLPPSGIPIEMACAILDLPSTDRLRGYSGRTKGGESGGKGAAYTREGWDLFFGIAYGASNKTC